MKLSDIYNSIRSCDWTTLIAIERESRTSLYQAGGYEFRKDGGAVCVTDSGQAGCDIYWDEKHDRWVIVNHEDQSVDYSDRIAAVRCNGDPEEGLNQVCLACDMDGRGLWIVDSESLEDFDDGYVDVEFISD